MGNLLMSIIVAVWVSAIALISVQNARPVSLRFLVFQSVEIPLGLVMAFSATLGMIGMGLTLPLQGSPPAPPEADDNFDED